MKHYRKPPIRPGQLWHMRYNPGAVDSLTFMTILEWEEGMGTWSIYEVNTRGDVTWSHWAPDTLEQNACMLTEAP